MNLKNKKVLVYGLGVSGVGAIELLTKKKAQIYFYDDINKDVKLPNNVIKVENLTENFLSFINLIVVNPSVSIYSENLKLASMLGIKIISEIELAYYFCKGKIISVTGSNGKSTTSTLIYNIFKSANIKSSLVGNIGKSFCSEVAKNPKQTFIVEVSSFQLETTIKYSSNIACFLNLTENHLDRHFSIKEYFETKCKIFKNQTKHNYSVLNYDDSRVKNIKTNSKTFYFSKTKRVLGAYILDDYIYFNNGKTDEKIMKISDIRLKGEHNLENVLCAIVVAKIHKISNEDIILSMSRFMGLSHRLEYVDEINHICFYNDSKSTTIKSVINAANSFKDNKILLILGGSYKGFGYEELFSNLPKNIKYIVAIGEVKDNILECAKVVEFNKIAGIENFNSAVNFSYITAMREGLDIILLSPGTASFDMFKNFEERGDKFKNLVEELKNETQIK